MATVCSSTGYVLHLPANVNVTGFKVHGTLAVSVWMYRCELHRDLCSIIDSMCVLLVQRAIASALHGFQIGKIQRQRGLQVLSYPQSLTPHTFDHCPIPAFILLNPPQRSGPKIEWVGIPMAEHVKLGTGLQSPKQIGSWSTRPSRPVWTLRGCPLQQSAWPHSRH